MRLALVALISAMAGCGGGGGNNAEDMAKAILGDMAVNSNNATLKLEDFDSWCSVTVNSGTASTSPSQSLPFAKGTVVNLSAAPMSATFVFGYWIGTAGDTGAAHDTNMATTIMLNADTTVQACCPFASAPTTPCGAP